MFDALPMSASCKTPAVPRGQNLGERVGAMLLYPGRPFAMIKVLQFFG